MKIPIGISHQSAQTGCRPSGPCPAPPATATATKTAKTAIATSCGNGHIARRGTGGLLRRRARQIGEQPVKVGSGARRDCLADTLVELRRVQPPLLVMLGELGGRRIPLGI